MGNNPSQPENIAPNYQLMRDEAMKIFNLRVKSYSYAHHGAYNEYVDLCRAQYELDCMPKNLRQGSNYTEKCDNWGNRIH